MISGGYDIPADQADIRAALALTLATPTGGRPEIQLFAAGTPDAMTRTVDVAALSSWLAVRAIDHETRGSMRSSAASRRLRRRRRSRFRKPPMPRTISARQSSR